ncbi:hypothetical protein ABZ922_16160 [Streptomyces shenzhenensis]|uniref:hypothetical protein n=1 Tax=Streptomyces shenzhenensis TaxID=943815 RepID=UPI0033CB8CD7
MNGALFVTATSALAPTGALMRALLPLLGRLLSVPALRGLAVDRLGRVRVKAAPGPRKHSRGRIAVSLSRSARRAPGWCGA